MSGRKNGSADRRFRPGRAEAVLACVVGPVISLVLVAHFAAEVHVSIGN